jgi:lipoprotein-anchoring transpeptidase ErfK/SrfK
MPRGRARLAWSATLLTLTLASCGTPERPQVSASSSSVPTTETTETVPPPSSVEAGTDAEPVSADGTIVARANVSELTAYSAPDEASEPVAQLANPIPSGGALVVRVLSPVSATDDPWLEVMLPVRPNGTTGWIRSDQVDLSVNPYRIEINASDFSLDLYQQDELVMSTTIAVGTGDTPTPFGEFYLAELLQPPDPSGSYGPYAFGLSGFSEVLDSFNGGNGVVGIHGTNDPAALGTTVSHGCVRVDNGVIEDMATTVPLGTPVIITR